MKMLKYVLLILVLMFGFTFLTGCNKVNKNKSVVFIPQSMDNGVYWDMMDKDLKNELEAAGYTYKKEAAKDWGVEFQAEILNKVVEEKPGAIIIAPCGSDPLFEGIKKANKYGTQVIVVDSDIDREFLASYGAYVTAFVGIDNYKCGHDLGELLAAKLPQNSQIAVFSGNVENNNGEARSNGFSDAVKEKGMDVIVRNGIDWSADDAYAKAKIAFRAYPNIKGVFSVNNTVNSGVYKAAEECGIKIISCNFDSDEEMLSRMQNDEVVAILNQDSKAMAKKARETIERVRKGEKVESSVYSEGEIITK